MAYNVFVSHSLAWGNDLLIAQICRQLGERHGVECHVALRTWKFGPASIPELEDAIASADCVLAIVTNDGTASSYVNQELGIARTRRKPVIAIAEDSAYLSPLLEKAPDALIVDFESPEKCAEGLVSRLGALSVDKRIATTLFWVVIAALGQIYISRS